MARLFNRLFRTVKRRIKQGLRDQRGFNLHRAGVRLLDAHDHEQVSVTPLAQEAGISVGAFYQRFPNKEAFLGRLVHERMGAAERTLDRDLDPARWRDRSAGAITRAIVTTTLQSLQGPGAAGVVRAALQRGHSDREKLAPLVPLPDRRGGPCGGPPGAAGQGRAPSRPCCPGDGANRPGHEFGRPPA